MPSSEGTSAWSDSVWSESESSTGTSATFVSVDEAQQDIEAKVNQIKDNLAVVAAQFTNRSSWLTRVSLFWGDFPQWQKILLGILLFGALITIGVVMHVIILVISAAIAAFVFMTYSLLLDAHRRVVNASQEVLKQGLDSLAALMGSVLGAFEAVRKDFAHEVDEFRDQNDVLLTTLEEQERQLTVLGNRLEHLGTIESDLQETERDLADRNREYMALNAQVQQYCLKLETMERAATTKVTQLQELVQTLSTSLQQMAAVNGKQGGAFDAALVELKTNVQQSAEAFSRLKLAMDQHIERLMVVQQGLDQGNATYKDLLRQHVQHVSFFSATRPDPVIGRIYQPAAVPAN